MLKLSRTRLAIIAHDLAMIPIAWLGAYFLRFNLEALPEFYWQQAWRLLPIVLVVQGAMFWYFGLYRGVWRFASVPDLVRILKAVATGLLLAASVIFLVNRLQGVPRSVFVLDGIVLLMLLGGPRLIYRWFKDRYIYKGEGRRALIVGAGQVGEMLARDMLRDPSSPYRPVGFVDDAARRRGMEIHGLQVAGTLDEIAGVARRLEVDLIVIALQSPGAAELRRAVERCEAIGLPIRIMPRPEEVVGGIVGFRDLREVSIEDLLGREPVQLDWTAIENGSRGRAILVTGGGGSIGAELCRQIARLSPQRLVVFERSEFNLFEIERELRAAYPSLELRFVLGDVCDAVAVDHAFRAHRPHTVFHAAAYKHVPMLEGQIRPAVMNNVFGTATVARAAVRHGCESFVLISSDKAVNPSSVMGATKRIAEIVCQDLNRHSNTRFVTVRFGNVLGSSGSVVPLFKDQLARGGPLTVTHPEVMRYFMTIPEACQLILQASVIGKGGEIFVLDMGEPIKIAYLAERLIRLSGKQPGADVKIVYTGLRPGEKLFEELFHGAEKLGQTRHPKILRANARELESGVIRDGLAAIESACAENNLSELERLVRVLVPEQKAPSVAEQHVAGSAAR